MVCTHHITMVHSKDWRGFGDILIVGISQDRQSHTYPSAPRIRLDILHPLDFAGALEALHVGAQIFSDLVVLGRGKSGKGFTWWHSAHSAVLLSSAQHS